MSASRTHRRRSSQARRRPSPRARVRRQRLTSSGRRRFIPWLGSAPRPDGTTRHLKRGRAFLSLMRARMRSISGSLAARTFLASAAVLALIFVLLLVTPVEVSAPIQLGQALILFAGLLAMLAIQLVVIRRVLAPLRRVADQMHEVDLRQPQQRRIETTSQSSEITTFVETFNDMLERLANERRQSARTALGAQEAERLRTAQELHDEIGQSLTAVALRVEQLAAAADPPTAVRLGEVAELLQGSLDD